MIGVTGAGKSTLCNFFFQEAYFKTGSGRISVTEVPTAHCHTINGTEFYFIDTPGFCDEYESNEDRMMDIATTLFHAKDGVHAIVICINGRERHTTADKDLLEELNALGTFWPHAFVIYTNGAELGETEESRKQTVLEWYKSRRSPPSMKKLLEYVKFRYMVVESTSTTTQYYHQKCSEFDSLVNGVLVDNCYRSYHNPLFVWAKERFDAREKEFTKTLQEKDTEMHKKIEEYTEKLKEVDKKKKELLHKNGTLNDTLQACQENIKELQNKMVI